MSIDPRPIAVIESPYAGDINKNVAYARACIADSLRRGEAPFASHLLYTQRGVLDDSIPSEREMGMSAGWAFYHAASVVAVYTDLGQSSGMLAGLEVANRLGVPVEWRTLPSSALNSVLWGG